MARKKYFTNKMGINVPISLKGVNHFPSFSWNQMAKRGEFATSDEEFQKAIESSVFFKIGIIKLDPFFKAEETVVKKEIQKVEMETIPQGVNDPPKAVIEETVAVPKKTTPIDKMTEIEEVNPFINKELMLSTDDIKVKVDNEILPEDVKNKEESKKYLASKGIATSDCNTLSKVKALAKKNGITFINL
jgi:hypothetical protein